MIFMKRTEKLKESASIKPENTPKAHDKFKERELWDSNEGRRERIAKYRQLTLLDEDAEITEDNIQDWALKRVCVNSGWPIERVKAELLGQKYTGLEED